VRINQIDGEAIAQELGVVAEQACAVPGAALEVQEPLALTDDLV